MENKEITQEYLDSLDKRTNEYKEAKKRYDKASSGLGDTVEKITKATGIKKVVDAITDDCGCGKRKEQLNKLFKYNKPKCLEEDEYHYLNAFFSQRRTSVSVKDNQKLTAIWERIFGKKYDSSCSSCNSNNWKKEIYNKLEKVWRLYK